MDQTGISSVKHRMAQAARGEFDARAMSPAKAMRLSVARVADTMLDLPVTVTTVEQSKLPAAKLQETIGDAGLIVLLDGEGEPPGAIWLDIQMLAALIEVQTLGEVRDGAVQARVVTRTDAAIIAPFVDQLMAEYQDQCGKQSGDALPEQSGFTFADWVEDTRALSLALEEPYYASYTLSLTIAGGRKSGVLKVLLPYHPPVRTAMPETQEAAATSLSDSAMNAPAVLDAVMARVRLPLDRLSGLEVGDRLPIDVSGIENTQLLGAGGHVVAQVRLGKLNGWRAVRIMPEAEAPRAAILPVEAAFVATQVSPSTPEEPTKAELALVDETP